MHTVRAEVNATETLRAPLVVRNAHREVVAVHKGDIVVVGDVRVVAERELGEGGGRNTLPR